MKEAITSSFIGALVLGAMFWAGLLFVQPVHAPTLGGSIDVPAYTNIGATQGTSTTKAVTTSSLQIIATSTGISYLIISNGFVPISCQADQGKPAVAGSGINIASSSQYVFSFDSQNLYRGTINCITAAGTSNIGVYAH